MLCTRVKNLLSAYCDHELTGAEMFQIRRHLDACPSCRQEHVAICRVKRLMGALAAVEATRSFHPEMLQQRRAWYSLAARQAAAYCGCVPLACSSAFNAVAVLLRQSGASFATGGVLGLVLLTAGLLQQPQHPDAVSAHVPEAIVAEEAAPVWSAAASEVPMDRAFSESLAADPPLPPVRRARQLDRSPYFLRPEILAAYDGYSSPFERSMIVPLTHSGR